MFLSSSNCGDNTKIIIITLSCRNLISHCIDLLKACHILTGRLVSYTMDSSANVKSPNEMVNIVTAAKDIQPR